MSTVEQKIKQLENEIADLTDKFRSLASRKDSSPGLHDCAYREAFTATLNHTKKASIPLNELSDWICEECNSMSNNDQNTDHLMEAIALFFVNYNNQFYSELNNIESDLQQQLEANDVEIDKILKELKHVVRSLNRIKTTFKLSQSRAVFE